MLIIELSGLVHLHNSPSSMYSFVISSAIFNLHHPGHRIPLPSAGTTISASQWGDICSPPQLDLRRRYLWNALGFCSVV